MPSHRLLPGAANRPGQGNVGQEIERERSRRLQKDDAGAWMPSRRRPRLANPPRGTAGVSSFSYQVLRRT
jgi:hypothetical protein